MKLRINWDALGIATSVACAIHCAILPLILSSLPVFGMDIIDHEGFEYLMIALAMVIGTYSLWHGYRRHHHNLTPIAMFAGGISFLVAKQIWHDQQYWLLSLAVIAIVWAHLINYRACRVHNHAHSEDCNH